MTTKDELRIYHVFVFGFPFFAFRSPLSALRLSGHLIDRKVKKSIQRLSRFQDAGKLRYKVFFSQ